MSTPVVEQPALRSVVLAVCTYQRPADLAAVVPLLRAQAAAQAHRVRILVIDNDPAGGAEQACAELGLPASGYVHEPRPGIAAARNSALDATTADDVLIFIDDDERPEPGWLDALLETFERSGSAGVVGRVESSFDGELDPWIAAGGFFTRRTLPTGATVEVAATNNLLLDRRVVERLGLRFDERFGLSGGSDTLFTRTLVASGAELVWCHQAVVTDVVPAARATRSWVLRRHLRSGNTESRVLVELAAHGVARARVRLQQVVRGGARVLGGAAKAGLGVATRDLGRRAHGARNVARGSGMVSGALGHVYSEYKRS